MNPRHHRAMARTGLALTLSLLSLVAPAAPDPARGEAIYVRCLGCHTLATDRVGPRHCGLIGRRAGAVAGFEYSPAMLKSQLVWDEKTLDRFLKKPLALVPGSDMTYDGIPDASDRRDLIAYLKKVNAQAICRTPQ